MSISTDGILFWGVDLGPEEDAEVNVTEEQLEEVCRKYGLEYGYHCSDGYPMIYLAPKGMTVIAARGYPKDAGELFLKLEGGEEFGLRDQLKLAVGELGLPWTEPRLLLTSYWG